ncbi:VWA domain-containing protein [Flavicella marina]|uniref:VWA domain-containing protein n=1 Tax=Flavicella marina TaxID=1475951 RepID=UPI001264A2A5|nr:VWA domain-containing protein [Flavicella marina]
MIDSLNTELFEDFHFLRPHFLWLLIPLGILLLLLIVSRKEEVKWKKEIPLHLRPFMIQKGNQSKVVLWKLVLYLIVAIGMIGLSGPTWSKIEIPGKTLETPMVIVLDLSQSMMAADIQPSRLERAKFKIMDLLKENPGARVALVGFSGTAHVILPLTNDYSLIDSHINQLSPSVMPFYGSDLNAGIEKAIELTNVTEAPATIVVFSDDFTDESFAYFNEILQKTNSKFEIFPVNTLTGSTIPIGKSNRLMKDSKGENVHSKLNEDVLQKMNSLAGIRVNYLTLDNSDVALVAKKIKDHLKFTDKAEEKEDDWEDQGLFFIIPFTLIILIYFRKGMAIYFLLIIFTSCSNVDDYKDLWFTKDYQGQLAFDNSNFDAAAKLFENPLRKGVAYYKAGNYDEAIRAFSKDSSAEGMYNLGLSYYKNGDYAAAALAFGKTIEIDSTFKQAKKNLQISQYLSAGTSETSPEAEVDSGNEERVQNEQNKSPEDLSGGGQEATEKDMQKKRLEETTNTDIRKGKELDELPDDFELGKPQESPKILMQKVDDDPSLFLKRKFRHQVKVQGITPNGKMDRW